MLEQAILYRFDIESIRICKKPLEVVCGVPMGNAALVYGENKIRASDVKAAPRHDFR